MTIDEFYTEKETKSLYQIAKNLRFSDKEFGKEIENFNMVPEEADKMFSDALNIPMTVISDRSGIFRVPEFFIHFEPFESTDEWLFVVAIDLTTFDIYEHESGIKSALQGHKFNYRDLFQWNHCVNYQLAPSQGVFFRPWLFHSFQSGLIQIFRLREKNANRI